MTNSQSIQDGLKHHQAGRLPKAERIYQQVLKVDPNNPDALHLLGVIAHQLGKNEFAVQLIEKAIRHYPSSADFLNHLGEANRGLGRLGEALASYDKALAIEPDFAEALSNRGTVLQELKRYDEALANYDKALAIRPDYAEALNNRGTALQELKRHDEALASYDKALSIQPDYAEVHRNLGTTLHDLGRLDEAESSIRRALQIKPDYADALNNLALLLNEQGKSSMALNIIRQSLQIKETGEAKSIFVACVKGLRCTRDDGKLRIAMVRALTEPWGRPNELAPISTELIKLNPDFAGCMGRAGGAWPVRLSAQDLFGSNGLTALAANPLLCTLLNSAPICDIEMERFLTMARHAMLEAATGGAASDGDIRAALNFYSALARQCFINEYVFSYTDDEIRRASDLRDSLVAALEANTQVPALCPVAVGAYFPLCSIPLAARLLDREWPKTVTPVLVQQVGEPAEELQVRATIPRLTDIEDEVSLLVRNQYEENPYPRWVKSVPARKPTDIHSYLGSRFPLTSLRPHDKSGGIDVLIAGCGTGQHSIETAQQFQGAQVLAIDLSLSSLGYAKRKTRELGLTSIEYAHADLLKLDLLGRSFDIIECVGVLHHLSDPLAGWRVLLSLLRPGGLMKLGFYSGVARRNIARIRDVIAEQGYGTTADEIRRCRQELVNLDKSADFGTILKTSDFFSISACRDLLFHVQEHHLKLSDIDAFLKDQNLAFLGFEIDAEILLRSYKLRFPNDHAATDLGQWQIFESENPDTFMSMYQFWIQKAG